MLLVAGTTPQGREAPASEGDPRVRGQVNQGNAAIVAMANLQTPRDRDATPPGRSEVPLTQPSATPATPGDTSSDSGDSAGEAAATRGRRGRSRGSERGSRATGNGRGAATNRGRIPRPGGSEPPSDPGSRRGSEPPSAPGPRGGGGEESELRREEGSNEGRGPASGSVGRPRAFIDASHGTLCTLSVWWKLSEGVGHTHNSCAVHVGAQPAMGDGHHWRQQYRLILDSALRSRDWEGGRTTTGANGGKSYATRGTKIR